MRFAFSVARRTPCSVRITLNAERTTHLLLKYIASFGFFPYNRFSQFGVVV